MCNKMFFHNGFKFSGKWKTKDSPLGLMEGGDALPCCSSLMFLRQGCRELWPQRSLVNAVLVGA